MTGPAPIADYALLSDGQGAALVSRAGSVDWACLPRFDAPSTFSRILGADAGHWALAPAEPYRSKRAYLSGTMVLRTEFHTDEGSVAVTDALAFAPHERGHEIGRASPHALIRLVEGLAGTVTMASEVAPRPEYGVTAPRWTLVDGGAVSRGGPTSCVLSSPIGLDVDRGTASARFGIAAGERRCFVVQVTDPWSSTSGPWSEDDSLTWLDGTIEGWRSWSDMHQNYDGPYREQVRLSGMVLQALTYAPTGAVIAAPTTSLPESPGGSRNWDYRYAWVRDASMTLAALWVAACPDEIASFFDFFVTAAGGRHDGGDPLQVLYGIGGERRVEEFELDHLPGHADSRPVRVGNAAWRQRQLDVYGELLDAAHVYADRVGSFAPEVAEFLADVADAAADQWHEPDQGIWELRGEPRHFLYSKLMCWVALDRAARLAEDLGTDRSRVRRWCHERDEVRSEILRSGWNDDAGAFTQAFGSEDLDAAALMIPIVGFLPADDPRVVATVTAVAEQLTDDHGLVHRYLHDDGLDGDEATFGICTYWLAQAQAMLGDVEAARRTFEAVTAFANDVGLLAEEIDSTTGALLGNFPQAFTHIGLVNAAQAIAEATATDRD